MEQALLSKSFVVGTIAYSLGKKAEETATHEWTVYLRPSNPDEDMSNYIKRVVFVKFPILFDVEESLKKLHAGYIRPALQKLGIIDFLFGVDGIVPMTVKRAGKTWVACIKFRWICDWCPPFMRKLKQEVDQEEQEALAEEQAQDLERRQAAAAGGGDDGGDAGTG